MKSFIALFTLCAFVSFSAFAQDRHDWQQSLAHLHPGDRLHLSLKTSGVDATFLSFTPQDLTLDTGTFKKEDVLRIETVQEKHAASSRTNHALIGGVIGAGAGAGIGASAGACGPNGKIGSTCLIPRGAVAGVGAGIGLAAGLLIGALLPTGHGKRHMIYSA